MVTDLIKIPCVKNLLFRNHLYSYSNSILNITSQNIIISHQQINGDWKEIWIFFNNIDDIQTKFDINNEYQTIVVRLKSLETCYFHISNLDDAMKLTESLNGLINYSDQISWDVSSLFPFSFKRDFEIIEDGWNIFSIELEFSRLKTISDDWRLSDVNKNFTICETYPERLIVPKSISDEYLRCSASFRHHARFPLLSYLHKTSKSCLIRSAQPLTGIHECRCKEDEALINAMLNSRDKKGWILDTRHPSIVKSAQSRGGGSEPEQYYTLWKRLHRHLDKHIVLQDSFRKFIEACTDQSEQNRWITKLEDSNWFFHIKEVLTTACIIAQTIDREETSILVHGNEGWDTTLLVTSLAQILLDPNSRTIIGFESLIEREWIKGGHPFRLRCARSAFGKSIHGQESPLFLLFLDCTWQLTQQFACSFEFNEIFLIELFDHIYSSKFGTFIFNNEKEKIKLNGMMKTISLWSYLNQPDILRTFLNPFYEPNLSVLWPSVAPQSIFLWRSLYLRFYEDQTIQRQVWNEYMILKEKELELRSYVNKLRQDLLALEGKYLEKISHSNAI